MQAFAAVLACLFTATCVTAQPAPFNSIEKGDTPLPTVPPNCLDVQATQDGCLDGLWNCLLGLQVDPQFPERGVHNPVGSTVDTETHAVVCNCFDLHSDCYLNANCPGVMPDELVDYCFLEIKCEEQQCDRSKSSARMAAATTASLLLPLVTLLSLIA